MINTKINERMIDKYLEDNPDSFVQIMKHNSNINNTFPYSLALFNHRNGNDYFKRYSIRKTEDIIDAINQLDTNSTNPIVIGYNQLESHNLTIKYHFLSNEQRKSFLHSVFKIYDEFNNIPPKEPIYEYKESYIYKIVSTILFELRSQEQANSGYIDNWNQFFKDLGYEKSLEIFHSQNEEITKQMVHFYGLKGLRQTFNFFTNAKNEQIKEDFYHYIKDHFLLKTKFKNIQKEYTDMVFKLFNHDEVKLKKIGFLDDSNNELEIKVEDNIFKFNINLDSFIKIATKNHSKLTADKFFHNLKESKGFSTFLKSFDWNIEHANNNICLTVTFYEKNISNDVLIEQFKKNIRTIINSVMQQSEIITDYSPIILSISLENKMNKKYNDKNKFKI